MMLHNITPREKGFSLIEIIISFSIIAIMLAIALPAYFHHLLRAERMTAEIALTKLAAALEQYHLTANSYKNSKLEDFNIDSPRQYQLEIVSATPSTFMLAAHPLAEQAEHDKECATLTLQSTGERGITGLGKREECW